MEHTVVWVSFGLRCSASVQVALPACLRRLCKFETALQGSIGKLMRVVDKGSPRAICIKPTFNIKWQLYTVLLVEA